MMHYEKYQVKRGKYKGQWRLRLIADNGEKIIPPESYHNQADVDHVIGLIKSSKDAPVVEK
jgi:uncharacterized protein YegP (UPF0339 family)